MSKVSHAPKLVITKKEIDEITLEVKIEESLRCLAYIPNATGTIKAI